MRTQFSIFRNRHHSLIFQFFIFLKSEKLTILGKGIILRLPDVYLKNQKRVVNEFQTLNRNNGNVEKVVIVIVAAPFPVIIVIPEYHHSTTFHSRFKMKQLRKLYNLMNLFYSWKKKIRELILDHPLPY